MSRCSEIITFQVGTYANYVGAHFFNLQDPVTNPDNEAEFNSKVLWRECINQQRQKIFTPRLLMFDLKDNWEPSFIRSSANLPGTSATVVAGSSIQSSLDKIEKTVAWDGKIRRVDATSDSDSDEDSERRTGSATKQKAKKKIKLGQCDYDSWGEYTKWRLHETDKFAFRIPNFMYNAESDEIASYGQGLDIYGRLEDNVEEGIRQYAEDCDYLEGFQMLVDEYDGFTGIAGGILEHLGDEYDKKACLGLGLNRPLPGDPETRKGYKIRISNMAQLWNSFSKHSRVFSSFGVCENVLSMNPQPKKFTSIIQDCTSPVISSAILAATLDSLTAPYRLQSPSFPLHEFTSLLNAFGHKMTLISSALPFPLNHQTLFSTLDDQGLSSLKSLTPTVKLNLDESLGNIFVVRGIKPEQVMSKSEIREYKHTDIKSVTSCLELYCQETYPKSVHVIKDIKIPFKSVHPFSSLYEANFLEANAVGRRFTKPQGDCWLMPAVAGAHNTPAIGQILEKLVNITGGGTGGSAMKMKMFYESSSETCNSKVVEFEDYAECINDLSTLRDSY